MDAAPAVHEGRDDQTLAARAAARDSDAFAELYRRYVGRVYGFAYRRTGSVESAEEVTASTFERALRAMPRFRWRGGGFGPWLFRIAANEVSEHHRRWARAHSHRAQRALRVVSEAPVEDIATVVVERGGSEAVHQLRVAITRLRPRYQEAISLRYLAGLSADDAAAAMGCSKPTLAVILHRAMAALRHELGATP